MEEENNDFEDFKEKDDDDDVDDNDDDDDDDDNDEEEENEDEEDEEKEKEIEEEEDKQRKSRFSVSSQKNPQVHSGGPKDFSSTTSLPTNTVTATATATTKTSAAPVSADEFMSVLLAATKALNLSKSSEDKFPSLTSSISSTNTVKVDKEELKDKNVNVDMDTGGRKKPTVVSLDDCMQAMDDELYGDDDGTTGVIKKGSLVGTSFSRLNEENDDEVEEEEVVEEEEEEDEDNNYTNDDRSGSSKTQRKRPKKGDSGMHETEKGKGGRRGGEGRGGGDLTVVL
jgi:hypothetical protein